MASQAEAPPSPTASFYDMSDDEEGEYNTIRHTSSGKGVKLLYTKSKVRTTTCTFGHLQTVLTRIGIRTSLALV